MPSHPEDQINTPIEIAQRMAQEQMDAAMKQISVSKEDPVKAWAKKNNIRLKDLGL